MMPQSRLLPLTLAALVVATLAGCLDLKPVKSTTRYFVLSELPASAGPAGSVSNQLTIGIAPVKMAAYLSREGFALRRDANEVEFLHTTVWAERLDKGFQRVLAVNLVTLLPGLQVRLNSWRVENVQAEVQITIEQFDVNQSGEGTLVADWRVTSPGGDKVLKSGQIRASHRGPNPEENPQGATATLSDLAAQMSRELALAIAEASKTTVSK
jgi:uncharacterized lipoprotein YmbA